MSKQRRITLLSLFTAVLVLITFVHAYAGMKIELKNGTVIDVPVNEEDIVSITFEEQPQGSFSDKPPDVAPSTTVGIIPKKADKTLVVYYPFNGNANDASGNGNHAIVYGATLVEDRFGNPSSAYRFDGRDNYLYLSNPLPIFSHSFTISMWVKVPSNATGRVGILIGDYGIPKGLGINLEIHSRGQIRFYWNGSPDIYGKKDLRDNQWHHLVFVRDKEKGMSLGYVDGAVDILWAGKLKDRKASVSHRIGRDQRAGDTAFEGAIDDIRIYTRVVSP